MEDFQRVKKKDVKKVAAMFSKAFKHDPLAEYMFSDEETRESNLQHYFTFRITYGVLFGEVYATSDNMEGAAVWISPKNTHMTNWKMFRAGGMKLFNKLGKEIISKMMTIEKYTSEIHHRNTAFPHWHLTPIAVHPEFQGKGFASSLMKPMMKRFDDEKTACFLETQSKINVEIYKKYGFDIVEEGIIPEINLNHWAMVRHPK